MATTNASKNRQAIESEITVASIFLFDTTFSRARVE